MKIILGNKNTKYFNKDFKKTCRWFPWPDNWNEFHLHSNFSFLKGNLEENFIATKISNGYGCLNVKEVKNGYKIILSTHSNFYIWNWSAMHAYRYHQDKKKTIFYENFFFSFNIPCWFWHQSKLVPSHNNPEFADISFIQDKKVSIFYTLLFLQQD